MKPLNRREQLRERAVLASSRTFEAYWVWAMQEAHWQIVAGRFREARKSIIGARTLRRKLCRELP